MNKLKSRLKELSRTPVLLVASDFDGTLSPLASEPSLAKPNREAIEALHALSTMPQTHVAIISGRSLRDLSSLAGFNDKVHLVGSHGGEFGAGFDNTLDAAQVALRDRVHKELLVIAAKGKGFFVEEKPAGVALHFRLADERLGKAAVEAVLRGPANNPGVHVKHGKQVIELSVISTNKGMAFTSIRRRVGATAAIFIGDDESDEDAFAILSDPDVGVKVGEEPTKASFRIADTSEVASVLSTLVGLREIWLEKS